MVLLKEYLQPVKNLSKLGMKTFSTSIFKDEARTPHFEMGEVLNMIETRPMIDSGLNDFVRFVMGPSLIFRSSDKKSREFLKKWFEQREHLREDIFSHLLLSVGCGNAYFQLSHRTLPDGRKVLDNVFHYPDPSRIYYNLNRSPEEQTTGANYWVLEVPQEVQSIMFNGEALQPKMWQLSYSLTARYMRSSVYGVGLHKDMLSHFKMGWSRNGYYGRGVLNSGIDDNDILQEILKNMAIIARNRAVNNKFIQIGSDDIPDSFPDQKEIEDLEKEMDMRKEMNFTLINKPVKAIDFSSEGRYDTMVGEIDFLRKDISSGLVPTYLTPWNSEVNRATASEVKVPFALKLNSIKESYLSYLNKFIIDNLRKQYSWLSKDLRIDFDEVDLDSMEDKMRNLPALFRDNIITRNELRQSVGFDKIKDDDTPFFKDLQPQGMAFAAETDGAFTEAVKKADEADSLWRNRLKKKSFAKPSIITNLVVKDKTNLRGQILRYVFNPDTEEYLVFNGIQLMKQFESDEKKAARVYYDVLKDKIRKSFDDYYEGQTEEDSITDELFYDLKAMQSDVLKSLIKEIKSNKEALLSTNILGGLDNLFNSFNSRIEDIVGRTMKKVLDLGIAADSTRIAVGNDVKANDATQDLLQDKANVLTYALENQIKSFNRAKADEIKAYIAEQIAAGAPISEINQTLKDRYINFKRKEDPKDWKVMRIVRTEISKSTHLLKLLKWDAMGFTQVMHHTVVTPESGKKDVQFNKRIFDIKYLLENIDDRVPLHPNCRCFYSLYA